MYIAIGLESERVGVVKNGEIIKVMSSDSTLEQVVEGTGEEVESDLVGKRASERDLTQVSRTNSGDYVLSRLNYDQRVRAPGEKRVQDINFDH